MTAAVGWSRSGSTALHCSSVWVFDPKRDSCPKTRIQISNSDYIIISSTHFAFARRITHPDSKLRFRISSHPNRKDNSTDIHAAKYRSSHLYFAYTAQTTYSAREAMVVPVTG